MNHFYKDVVGDWVCLKTNADTLRGAGIKLTFEATAPVGDIEVSVAVRVRVRVRVRVSVRVRYFAPCVPRTMLVLGSGFGLGRHKTARRSKARNTTHRPSTWATNCFRICTEAFPR